MDLLNELPNCHGPQGLLKTFTFNIFGRGGHGAMISAWRSADVAACRAVSEKYDVSPSQYWDIVKMLWE